MSTPEKVLITREQAYARGSKTYYTGKPCKHGHHAERYTNGGACVACFRRYRVRMNPWTGELEPYHTEQLWAPRTLDREQRILMRHYLQTCIYSYARAMGLMTNGLTIAEGAHLAKPPQLEDPRLND